MWLNFRINFTVGISCIFLIGPPSLPASFIQRVQILQPEWEQIQISRTSKDQEYYVEIKTGAAPKINYFCRPLIYWGSRWMQQTDGQGFSPENGLKWIKLTFPRIPATGWKFNFDRNSIPTDLMDINRSGLGLALFRLELVYLGRAPIPLGNTL